MKVSLCMVKSFLLIVFILTAINCVSVLADETAAPVDYVTNDRVNFRTGKSTESEVIAVLERGTAIKVSSYVESGWSEVTYNEAKGYINSEFIVTKEDYKESSAPNANVELLDWWTEAKHVFTIGIDAKVYDVRTGVTYYVRSFSNGNHADVEPITKEDTATLKETYSGRWQWDPRPVLVTINGRTMAASINGMPHGGGVNNDNGMNGQVCIHFKNSTTHNGNKSFERDHQAGVMEAWAARQK